MPTGLTYSTITDAVTDPLFIYPFIVFSALQPCAYFIPIKFFPKTFHSELQRGWILTALNSLLMTAVSIPFILNFIWSNLPLDQAPMNTWDFISKPLCAFFVSYLFADLIMGTFLYPSQVLTC